MKIKMLKRLTMKVLLIAKNEMELLKAKNSLKLLYIKLKEKFKIKLNFSLLLI